MLFHLIKKKTILKILFSLNPVFSSLCRMLRSVLCCISICIKKRRWKDLLCRTIKYLHVSKSYYYPFDLCNWKFKLFLCVKASSEKLICASSRDYRWLLYARWRLKHFIGFLTAFWRVVVGATADWVKLCFWIWILSNSPWWIWFEFCFRA